jgi:hypothetical protein
METDMSKSKKKGAAPMAMEKPVQVKPSFSEDGHKLETRVFARNIHETYCMEPKCRFFGEHAVQNVCHTTTTMGDSADWSYIDDAMQAGDAHLKSIRKQYKGKSPKEYTARLENEVRCIWTNSQTTLDECVRLRGEVELLKKARRGTPQDRHVERARGLLLDILCKTSAPLGTSPRDELGRVLRAVVKVREALE